MSAMLKKHIQDSLAKGISQPEIIQTLLANGWPSADINETFAELTTPTTPIKKHKSSSPVEIHKTRGSLILRIGLAFTFIYPAILSTHPSTGGGYVPEFITAIIPLDTFLFMFAIFEWFLAVWILTGKLKLLSGFIAAALVITITILNYEVFSLLFRNVGIIAAALAFALL